MKRPSSARIPTPVDVERRVRSASEARHAFHDRVLDGVRDFLEDHAMQGKTCASVGIASVSPNDLRRTFASWLAERGVPEVTVAQMLGHRSSAMVRRVYARIGTSAQHAAIAALPSIDSGDGAAPARAARDRASRGAGGTVSLIVSGQRGRGGRRGTENYPGNTGNSANSCDPAAETGADTDDGATESKNPAKSGVSRVPRDRIELPTRGFSIPCSTN